MYFLPLCTGFGVGPVETIWCSMSDQASRLIFEGVRWTKQESLNQGGFCWGASDQGDSSLDI